MTFKYPSVLVCSKTGQKLLYEKGFPPTKNCVPGIYSLNGRKAEKAFVKFFYCDNPKKRDLDFKRFKREVDRYEFLSENQYFKFYGSDIACDAPWLAMECDKPINEDDIFRLSICDKLSFLKDIISDICIIHKFSICHRDIKFDNIVQKPDGSYLLVDFGISCLIDSEEEELTGIRSKPFYKGAVPLEKQGDVFLHDRDFS